MRFVVVDLEATCWSKDDDPALAANQSAESEIIEIGAVALDAALQPLDEFQAFVRPERHPTLSAFCHRLTSISQQDVDQAKHFVSVFEAFDAWMGGTHGEGLQFVSWSRYDHRQLVLQCQQANLPRPRWNSIDAKVEFTEWVRGQNGQRQRFGMARALAHLKMEPLGTAHRGIDDARNLVRIFQHIRNPEHLSAQAQTVLSVMIDRHPLPTNVSHFRTTDPWARQWYRRVCQELIRLELVTDLGLGRGLEITARGIDVATSRR